MIHNPIDLYTLINDVVGYAALAAIFIFFMVRKELSCTPLKLAYDKTDALRKKNKFLSFLFSKWTWIVLNSALYVAVYYSTEILYSISIPVLSENTYFTLTNYFVILYFAPVFLTVTQLVVGMDVRHGMDLLTPFCALTMGLGKIGCFCGGCCYGIEWKGGAYNYTTGRVEFPVQLLEAFIGILISFILFFLLTKRKTKGTMYPLYMIFYSATRFMTEFLRGDHIANWLGMKPYQVLCLIGILIGSLWLVVIRLADKKGKRILYDTDLIAYLIEKKKA